MSQLRLSIASRLEDVALVGVSVRAVVTERSGLADIAAQCELCVVEAVNNAIIHAYQKAVDQRVEVAVEFCNSVARIEVCDRGRPMPEGVLERPRGAFGYDPEVPEILPEGGMGLGIIRQIMDEVRYASVQGQNVLTMELRWGRELKPPSLPQV